MTPTKLLPCIFRGVVVSEDLEFPCLHDARDSKIANAAACNECRLRPGNAFEELEKPEDKSLVGSVVSGTKRIVAGAVGTAKAYLGIDAASEAEIKKRYSICATCEMNICGQCMHEACHCFIGTKIRIASQSCPLEKWLVYDGDIQPVHGRKN